MKIILMLVALLIAGCATAPPLVYKNALPNVELIMKAHQRGMSFKPGRVTVKRNGKEIASQGLKHALENAQNGDEILLSKGRFELREQVRVAPVEIKIIGQGEETVILNPRVDQQKCLLSEYDQKVNQVKQKWSSAIGFSQRHGTAKIDWGKRNKQLQEQIAKVEKVEGCVVGPVAFADLVRLDLRARDSLKLPPKTIFQELKIVNLRLDGFRSTPSRPDTFHCYKSHIVGIIPGFTETSGNACLVFDPRGKWLTGKSSNFEFTKRINDIKYFYQLRGGQPALNAFPSHNAGGWDNGAHWTHSGRGFRTLPNPDPKWLREHLNRYESAILEKDEAWVAARDSMWGKRGQEFEPYQPVFDRINRLVEKEYYFLALMEAQNAYSDKRNTKIKTVLNSMRAAAHNKLWKEHGCSVKPNFQSKPINSFKKKSAVSKYFVEQDPAGDYLYPFWVSKSSKHPTCHLTVNVASRSAKYQGYKKKGEYTSYGKYVVPKLLKIYQEAQRREWARQTSAYNRKKMAEAEARVDAKFAATMAHVTALHNKAKVQSGRFKRDGFDVTRQSDGSYKVSGDRKYLKMQADAQRKLRAIRNNKTQLVATKDTEIVAQGKAFYTVFEWPRARLELEFDVSVRGEGVFNYGTKSVKKSLWDWKGTAVTYKNQNIGEPNFGKIDKKDYPNFVTEFAWQSFSPQITSRRKLAKLAAEKKYKSLSDLEAAKEAAGIYLLQGGELDTHSARFKKVIGSDPRFLSSDTIKKALILGY